MFMASVVSVVFIVFIVSVILSSKVPGRPLISSIYSDIFHPEPYGSIGQENRQEGLDVTGLRNSWFLA